MADMKRERQLGSEEWKFTAAREREVARLFEESMHPTFSRVVVEDTTYDMEVSPNGDITLLSIEDASVQHVFNWDVTIVERAR